MLRLRRSRIALAALALLVGGAGCATRPQGTGRESLRASRGAGQGSAEPGLSGRRGLATFGSGVRLRDDTPMLTPLLEASRAADAPAPSYGPQGATGEPSSGIPWSDPYPVYVNGYGPGYGPPGYTIGGGYYMPGGAVWPGLRPPPPPEVTSPYAAPFNAPPASDVSHHRPGLSTGTGIYGRGAGK